MDIIYIIKRIWIQISEEENQQGYLWEKVFSPFHPQDLISISPYWLLYNSSDVSLENFVLDQLIIPQLIFVYILIPCLLDIVLILLGEIPSWSVMGGLN